MFIIFTSVTQLTGPFPLILSSPHANRILKIVFRYKVFQKWCICLVIIWMISMHCFLFDKYDSHPLCGSSKLEKNFLVCCRKVVKHPQKRNYSSLKETSRGYSVVWSYLALSFQRYLQFYHLEPPRLNHFFGFYGNTLDLM